MRCGQQRINAVLRFGGVAAFARDGDIKLICRSHHRPRPDRKLAHRNAGHVVHAVNFINGKTVHHARFNHFAPAAAAFFGGLKDKNGGAIKIPRFGQILRRPQQHGGMPVMPAGVHAARRNRRITDPGLFQYRQRIHICAQRNHPPRHGFPARNHHHHARAPDASHHLITAKTAAKISHFACGALHIEQQFGVGVKIMAPRGDLGQQFGKAVLHRQSRFLLQHTRVT